MTKSATSDDQKIDAFVIIDEAHLATFTDGDAALEDELAELFITTSKGYLKRMKEAVQEERSWSAEAHALKGSAANLGAQRVAALAKRAEFMPPSCGEIEAIEAAIDDVKTFFTNREL